MVSLSVGDFDSDGRDDLAIGVPGDKVNGLDKAGSVAIIYGANQGLTASGNQIWNQNSANIVGGSEVGDRFGTWQAILTGTVLMTSP